MTNWAGVAEKHVFIFCACLSCRLFEAAGEAGALVAHVYVFFKIHLKMGLNLCLPAVSFEHGCSLITSH